MRALLLLALVSCGPGLPPPVAVRDTICQDETLQACRADWLDQVLVCTEGRWRPLRNCAPLRCDFDSGRFDCVGW